MDFDLCELECGNRKRGFTIMAGCGYDAAIMNTAAENKKTLGPLAYFYAAFANPNPQYAKFKLCIDGKTIEHEGVGVLLINFSKIQGDVSLATASNSPCDGMFDVLVLATNTAWNLLPAFIGAAIDKTGSTKENSDVLAYYRGREVTIEADPQLKIQYDGEPLDICTPLTARILPAAAKIIVSDTAYEMFEQEQA